MGEITVEELEGPRHRPDPEDALVVMQGWLHAPKEWDGTRLERLWNDKHGRSRLGVGLCVANSPRRHFVVSNVPYDVEAVRAELESLIAELESGPDEAVSDPQTVPAEDVG
ncbi:hypothetical protein [Intrasporangium sp. DVR]|uniref:hypothetical protein n=1 Tax=Intrasporangium sp. DVR TaxID=3127867 RepID=UPI00313A72C7